MEDDDVCRLAYCRILLRNNYRVYAARDAEQALRLLETEPIGVVIADLVLPKKSGLETIEELKTRFPEVRVIAVSGGSYGNPSWLPNAKRLGADEALLKPVSSRDLISSVRKIERATMLH